MESGIWVAVEQETVPTETAEVTEAPAESTTPVENLEEHVDEKTDEVETPAEEIPSESDKTLGDVAYEATVQEDLRKEREEALRKQMEESDLPITEEQRQEGVDKVVEEVTEVMEKHQDKDPGEILAEVAEVFYEKEVGYQRAIKEKDIEIDFLRKKNQELVDQINEIKYSEDRVKVDEEFKYLLNLQKRYKDNPKDELTVNRLIKTYLWLISTLEPAVDPETFLTNIKEERRKKVLALSGWGNTTTPDVKEPEPKRIPQWYAVGQTRKKL